MTRGIIENTVNGFRITVTREVHGVVFKYVKEFMNGKLVHMKLEHTIQQGLGYDLTIRLFNKLSACSMYFTKPSEGKPYGSSRIRSFLAIRKALQADLEFLNSL